MSVFSKKNRVWLVVAVVVALFVGARGFAWYSAMRFGQATVALLSVLSANALEDHEGLLAFYAEPDVDVQVKRVKALSFVAPDLNRSVSEFKQGMIYLSEQYSVPLEERFKSPPEMRNLKLDLRDRSNKGLFNATEKLVDSYRSAL